MARLPLRRWLAIALVLGVFLGQPTAWAQQVLEGESRLACEAILCLASASRPAGCQPSLVRYFSILRRKWSDTIRARLDFLGICPVQSAELEGVKARISQGAIQCDAATLNQQLSAEAAEGGTVIGDQLPYACSAYSAPYAGNGAMPSVLYVGTPARGGHWVDGADYEFELRAYEERIAREDREAGSGSARN